MNWLKVLIIRHALSSGNESGRMMGQLEDELTDGGQHQARLLAQHLLQEDGCPTAIYSSPIGRAAQTAQLLAEPLGMEVQYRDDLKELHGGIFQGLTWVQAQQRYPQLCEQLGRSRSWLPIPHAESPEDGYQRATRFLQEVLSRHSNGDRLWVISHAGLIQHLVAAILGGDRTWGLSIPNTSMFEFWVDRERWFTLGQDRRNTELWKIRRFNDVRHLE
ncbi:MAG: histidine phosphatase family protein [Leptolyngbyaceae bacterium]|nr:histidine phosphatase family protein [Leptolyngbyaceae bacterium]